MFGGVESRLGRRTAIAMVAHEAESRTGERPARAALRGVVAAVPAGEGADHPGASIDTEDGAGPLIRQVDIAVAIDRHTAGAVQLGIEGRPAIAAAPRSPAAGDTSDHPGAVVDPSNPAVAEVG